MTKANPFTIRYDRSADVLYLSKQDKPATRGIEDRFGIVWRYGADGDLIGATIVDFFEYWSSHKPLLIDELSVKFHIARKQADIYLQEVFSNFDAKV